MSAKHRQVIDGVTVIADLTEADDGRLVISRLELSGQRVTADVLRRVKVLLIENAANLGGAGQAPEPITRQRPDETRDAFSRRVAAAYRSAAAVSSRPAKAMAESSDIPVPTVRGWIREARLRGHLPEGHQGRAG